MSRSAQRARRVSIRRPRTGATPGLIVSVNARTALASSPDRVMVSSRTTRPLILLTSLICRASTTMTEISSKSSCPATAWKAPSAETVNGGMHDVHLNVPSRISITSMRGDRFMLSIFHTPSKGLASAGEATSRTASARQLTRSTCSPPLPSASVPQSEANAVRLEVATSGEALPEAQADEAPPPPFGPEQALIGELNERRLSDSDGG